MQTNENREEILKLLYISFYLIPFVIYLKRFHKLSGKKI